jgi:hypothetical protein
MPIPNGGLITETNAQYYAGTQNFIVPLTGVNQSFTSTFNTDLVVGTGNYSDPGSNGYNLNNFKVQTSVDANVWTELTPVSTDFDVISSGNNAAGQNVVNITANANVLGGNIFSLINKATGLVYGTVVTKVNNGGTDALTLNQVLPAGGISANTTLSVRRITTWSMSGNIVIIPQSLVLNTYVQIEMTEATQNNMHGGYEYTRLSDVIDNFLIAYVGAGKLITQELTVPSSLSLIIPQDYVNYVKLSWVDGLGVLHPIYPTNNLNQSPYETPGQDELGKPIQDSNFRNTETSSKTNQAWNTNNPRQISGAFINNFENANAVFDHSVYDGALGQRYGLEPQTSQKNGWFKIDERKGTFNFTSNLSNKLILLEYISDGNAYDLDSRIPKLAEEALYAHIIHSILSVSSGIQEYVVRRFKQERSAKLRNAKIRLSNLKLDQIIQVMRGKSKWIK